MNRKKRNVVTYTAALVICCLAASAGAQTPLGSEFTYQGKLDLLGTALNDTADFEFTLWDAEVAGNMIDAVVPVSNVTVVDGQFTVEIDFGVIAFNGDKRWLEIAVRSPAGGGAFTTLDPRQPLTAAPYALQTRGIFVNNAGNVGIGTTAPGAKLGVLGDIRVQSKITSSQGGLTLSGGGSGVHINLDEDGDSSDFFTISDTGVERFRVEGNTGNVGIGVVNPATKLEVDGTVTATAFVGDGSGLTGISGGDLAAVLGQDNDAGGADMLNLGTVNAAAFSSTSPLQLQTAGTTRIYVDDVTGNVGIGTTTPQVLLDIDGGDLRLDRAGLATSREKSHCAERDKDRSFPLLQSIFPTLTTMAAKRIRSWRALNLIITVSQTAETFASTP